MLFLGRARQEEWGERNSMRRSAIQAPWTGDEEGWFQRLLFMFSYALSRLFQMQHDESGRHAAGWASRSAVRRVAVSEDRAFIRSKLTGSTRTACIACICRYPSFAN